MIPGLLLVFGMSFAHAEPLDNTTVSVVNYDGNSANIKITWNQDKSMAKYEIGCVSCMPNISKFTIEDEIIIEHVTPFPNTSNALLYLIAYDSQGEIIRAKQILVNLEQ